MSVRCPKCQKKHEEPYPNRCGCGQSLVAVLAARRFANPRFSLPTTPDRELENAWTLPTWMGSAHVGVSPRQSLEFSDNEW